MSSRLYPQNAGGKQIGFGYAQSGNCDISVKGAANGLVCSCNQAFDVIPYRISDGAIIGGRFMAYTETEQCIDAVARSKGDEVCIKAGNGYEIWRISTATMIREAFFKGAQKDADTALCPKGAS